MNSRHEKCKPAKQTLESKRVPPSKPKLPYESLSAENKRIKKELEISLAANKAMKDELIVLTKRNDELTIANIQLTQALATEQSTSRRLLDLNENTKSPYVENQKLEGRASCVKKSVEYVEVEKIKASHWIEVRTKPQFETRELELKTKEKRKEMAKYMEDNVFGEVFRDVLMETLKLMFSKDFFVNGISFKPNDGDKIFFKGSNLLMVLQMVLATKFPEADTTFKEIQKKIRNFKDSLSKNNNLWKEIAESTQQLASSAESNQNLASSAESEQQLTFCSCNGPEFGEMILCDNNACPIKWYHFPCVSLVNKPKGKWYCPYCCAGASHKASKPEINTVEKPLRRDARKSTKPKWLNNFDIKENKRKCSLQYFRVKFVCEKLFEKIWFENFSMNKRKTK